ncbi:MAG: hypothetical protein AB7D42_00195 [Candidatus Methanomethylophilaceae archaeon]|nr:hypothetical protein [Candidatus Methanomethylophilaceae archaeon]
MKMDRKGMIGLPVRLAITFLILALTVPLLMGAVDDYRSGAEASALRVQAGIVSETAEKTYYAGEGGAFTAEVLIGHDNRMVIGGEGADAYTIRMFCGDDSIGRLVMDRPAVRIAGDGISISGERTLLFECVNDGRGCAVEVSVIA